jgi:hypothetical protein
MSFNNILTDTVACGVSDVAENRFVGVDGTVGVGKDYGITQDGGEAGVSMPVIVLGIAEVEVASGETIAAGNFVKPDADGKAVLDNTFGTFMALSAGTGGSIIRVFCAGKSPMTQALMTALLDTLYHPIVSYSIETTDASGEIAITGMTADGHVQVTLAEDPGANLVLSDVIPDAGKITVYTKNTNTDARAALASKKVFLTVWSLDTTA